MTILVSNGRGGIFLRTLLLFFSSAACHPPPPPATLTERTGAPSATVALEPPEPLVAASAPTAAGAPTNRVAPPVGLAGAADAGSQEQWAARFAVSRVLARYRGTASYYSDRLSGRRTASGARYDPRMFTAAHRSLPFGSIVRVRRIPQGQAVYVRITDRGPFGNRGRILDVSRAAAERLGMLRAGVVDVVVEVVHLGEAKGQ